MTQKGFASLLLLLFLVALAVGGYWVVQKQGLLLTKPSLSPAVQPSPSSAETTNWKTFQSDKLQYSFKYPSSLQVTLKEPDSTKEDYQIVSTSELVTNEGKLQIFVSKNNPDYNPTPCEKTKKGCGDTGGGGAPQNSTKKSVKVKFGENELNATELTFPDGKITISTSYPIYSNATKSISATFSIDLNKESSTERNLFYQILSTFKFAN